MWTDSPPASVLKPDGSGDLLVDTTPSATTMVFIKGGLWLEFVSGHIFLPALLIIFVFSRRAKRHFTLLNVLVAFIISSIIRCLLIWTNHATGHRFWSTHSLTCAVQAGLQDSIPPMWSAAVFALTIHTWNSASTSSWARMIPTGRTLDITLFCMPYAAFIVWIPSGMWWALMMHITSRSLLTTYCVSNKDANVIPMAIFCALLNICSITLQLNLLWIYVRTRRCLPLANRAQVDRGSLLRILIFGLYTSTSPLMSLLQAFAPDSQLPRFYASTLGVAFLFVFGSRKDVFQALMFWKRTSSRSNWSGATRAGINVPKQVPADV